jgi:hypothetical protein
VKVLLVGAFDTGGQGIRIVEAFRKHSPDWDVRSMAKTASYMNYGVDLPFRKRVLEDLYPKCDVIHVRNSFEEYDRLAKLFGPKPVVIHYHGSRFRGDPERHIAQQRERGAIGIVSTLDLYLLAPDDLEWLPAPYSVDWLASM